MASELQGKISALKSLSIDIGTEVKYQDKMFRDMVQYFIPIRKLEICQALIVLFYFYRTKTLREQAAR